MGSKVKYEILKSCKLFKNLSVEALEDLSENPNLKLLEYKADETIFNVRDQAKNLYILGQGTVTIEKNDINGKRVIVNTFKQKGTIFGEVYLYLEKQPYDYACMSKENTKILAMPRDFILHLSRLNKDYYVTVVDNMLEILSAKAYHLNQKLLILSSYTLRQKIANFLIQFADSKDIVKLKFNRQELAEYIGATRPSLSRELMNMVDEELIEVRKKCIKILNREYLENII